MKIQYVSEMNSNDDNKQARPPDHDEETFYKMTYDVIFRKGMKTLSTDALDTKFCFSDAQHVRLIFEFGLYLYRNLEQINAYCCQCWCNLSKLVN